MRGVPPPVHPVQCASRLMRLQLRVRMLRANFNQRCDLLNERVGRRSLPPTPIRRPSPRPSTAVPWRERPRDLTGSAISPAATEEVAHATLSVPASGSSVSGQTIRPYRHARDSEPLDDAHRRRYCEVIFCRLRIATPSTSPDAEHTDRGPQVTVRLFSRHTPWLLVRVTIRQRIMQSCRISL